VKRDRDDSRYGEAFARGHPGSASMPERRWNRRLTQMYADKNSGSRQRVSGFVIFVSFVFSFLEPVAP
jgi:hypothetical protein